MKKQSKYIKILKGYFDKLNFKIKLPTIKCRICGKDILDTPENKIYAPKNDK